MRVRGFRPSAEALDVTIAALDPTRIPARSPRGDVHALVEIPKGAHNKYEFDAELGVLRFDRALYSAVYYPTEYGFVPGTLGDDDEELDILVMIDQPTFPGCLIETRLLGAMVIERTGGRPERKLVAVPVAEPRFLPYGDISDVPEHLLREVEHFFDVFKELEERPVRSRAWLGAKEAEQALEDAIARHDERRRSGGPT